MEPGGVAALELSWSTLNSATAIEESELMAQFIASHSLSNEKDDEPSLVMQSLFWPDHAIDSCYGSQEINTNTYFWPMNSGCNFGSSEHESCYNSMESNMISSIELRSEPVVFYMKEEENVNTSHHSDSKFSVNDCGGAGEIGVHDIKKSKGKRKIQVCEPAVDAVKIESPAVSPKKKARTSSQAGKGSRRTNCKKPDKEADNTSPVVQSSSSYSSEDETNISEELSGGGCGNGMSPKGPASLISNGKTRAGRGSATDPQSLYARKRRERINERLRILQNLVPNGTKVDISTMLEEAVQYVKFLQVQIKLLSSDELWMYAPIAYGMNIGIDLKITPS